MISYLSLCLFYCVLGFKEGILWSKKGADAFKWNEHIVFAIERIGIGLLAFFAVDWQIILVSVLAFPFFHNGVYYWSRNLINEDVYDREFFDEPSSTSTAKINFSLINRIVGFVLSLILLIVYL